MLNNNNCIGGTRKIRTKYQGDDIVLYIRMKDKNKIPVNLVSTYSDIVVYAYTDYDDLVVMGSVVPKAGYVSLNVIDNYTYEFVIDSAFTTVMTPGLMTMEINFIKTTVNPDMPDGRHNSIAIAGAVLDLAESNIKDESPS